MKKVSVLVACYNAHLYLEQCLSSLFNQTLDDFEIIIVDDGSTDGSAKLIEQLCTERENVTFLLRKENLGVIKTRNQLLKMAHERSEFIAWCDADDIYHHNKLELQYHFLKKNKEYIGCGTWYKKIGITNRKIIKFSNSYAINIFTCFGSPIGFPTFMHKNQLNIFFNENLESSEDYQFITDISMRGKLTNLRHTLTFYRVHNAQESTQNHVRQNKVHQEIAYANCKLQFQEYEKFYPLFLKPDIWDEKSLDVLLSFISSLKNNPRDQLLASILDYRMLVYNKKKYRFLLKYLTKRGLRFLNIYQLYIR
ncbi:glycosyltransferase family 2 protein [Buttiauxella noackiae]|uniref:glycosyltransferase family 2 protein n=1 Tax=Buttiauxella noackiae TaxID=82992 RepID=UPI0035A5A21E